MEMARLANRLIRGLSTATLGAALLGAGGCGKPICPTGMRLDSRRSKPGVNAFCESVTDKSRAAFIELHRDGGGRRQVCPFVGGRPTGLYQAFHPDGGRWLEGRYENGVKVGRWTQWASDGRRVADGDYRDGQMVEGAPVGFPATCETIAW
jgi:hypothetical protein